MDAGVSTRNPEMVAANELINEIEKKTRVDPRNWSSEDDWVEEVLETIEADWVKLKCLRGEVSQQGIVGTAVIADLFKGAESAIQKLEEAPLDGL